MQLPDAAVALDKIDSCIQELVTPQQYRTWFQSLKITEITQNDITFSVSNNFLREWISHYYQDTIRKAVFQVYGRNLKISICSDPDSESGNDHIKTKTSGSNRTSREKQPPVRNRDYHQNPALVSRPGNPDIVLNSKYTFDNFIIGPSNQLAYAAAVAVSDFSSLTYNPLFLHGSVGLGKTHLLQAVCHKQLITSRERKILYLSCETFTNQFISAIETGDLRNFRNKYRHIDLILVDDIHLIANKERTQEEFFHTFNSLYNAGKQIVLSSDSPPSEIPTLQERLISRFKWGLVAQIEPPNFETRFAILRKKAHLLGHEVPDDILNFLAENVNTNIRELEGAITKVIGYSVLTESPLDLALSHRAMRDVLKTNSSKITIDDIVRVTTKKFNVKLSDLQSKKRNQSITLPRQICMYVAKKHTPLSLQEIGGYFGGRDHTTVIYAIDKITKAMKNNEQLYQNVSDVMIKLGKD